MQETAKTVCFGEILWDVFDGEKTLGGAPLNFAYYCAKLGADSKIISAVGDDESGTSAVDILSGAGVDCSGIGIAKGLPTGRADVRRGRNGEPEFEILTPAAWDSIIPNSRAMSMLKGARAFYFGTLARRAAQSESAWKDCVKALPPECIKIFDANLRQNFHSPDLVGESLEAADILKINAGELEALRCAHFPDSKESDSAVCRAILEKFRLKFLLLTRGADGFSVFDANSETRGRAIPPQKFVDSVGAGDSFTAAFSMAVIRGADAAEAAAEGARLASKVCSARGALCL
ncbi:MAG: hypothetical protein DBX55_02650 [Verrucomicrobia bacterium]|nr:MAG: hypothetical protein DBX55_02650 [Verrucomicrobiota bacterium]